jgi:replicative DNA helicase
MFIFREEVYKHDDPDLQGKAEIIIAKQRNGPTGRLKLAFLKNCTRFETLADGGIDPTE